MPPEKQLDLRQFGMPNILPTGGESAEDDPFCGEIPDDMRGYASYRSFYEKKMNDMIGGTKTMQLKINCEGWLNGRRTQFHEPKLGHEGSGVVIACNHVIFQDETNPEGVRYYPLSRGGGAGFYLCKTCMRLEETGVSMKCAKCVLDSIMKINETHPDRLINLQAL